MIRSIYCELDSVDLSQTSKKCQTLHIWNHAFRFEIDVSQHKFEYGLYSNPLHKINKHKSQSYFLRP